MKKFFAIITVAGFLTACNNGDSNKTNTDTSSSTTTVDSIHAVKDSLGTNSDTGTTKPAGVTADTSKMSK